jgi:hypothetical protein
MYLTGENTITLSGVLAEIDIINRYPVKML